MQCLSHHILIADRAGRSVLQPETPASDIWSLGNRHSGQNSHFSQNALSHAAVELSSRVGKQFFNYIRCSVNSVNVIVAPNPLRKEGR